jgi:EAL domain-containing protein (putative c-di-GMP-specific phosphodiesterase class I)/CHASE2 domain-containing sensor protein
MAMDLQFGSGRRGRWARRTGRWALPLVTMLAGVAVLASGGGKGVEQQLRSWRDQIRMHPASGGIVIVEVDQRSLSALNQWPWPRRHHADLIDRLGQARASLIAFDVNFEVQSNPADDRALASALERWDGLVALPAFQQREGAGSSRNVETLPYEPFRQNAFLAGVNVEADEDGLVRRLPLGTQIAEVPRPSMASLLAESAGNIDEMLEIDYAIDPASIPRLSFVDVLNGRVEASAIEGKKVFIGGTAADMQDRYTVPIHGVLPGVVVQALAAETIINGGVPFSGSGLWPLLLALLAIALAARPGAAWRGAAAIAAGTVLVILLPLAAEQWFAVTFPVVPALVALLLGAVGAIALQVGERFRQRSLVDAETQMPNLRALGAALDDAGEMNVVVARIDRFAALASGLGPAATIALIHRVSERLRASGAGEIYRVDENSLAWVEPAGSGDALDQRLGAVAVSMRSPIEVGRLVDVTLGMGVAETCRDEKGRGDAKQQVANAALAADRAIRNKQAFLHFAESDDETGWHLSLLGELKSAMAAGEVWNAYQPKLDIASGRIIGVETLVRWSHRERGPVGPDRFIPVVEAAGRAADLTAHVFRSALADARRWQEQGHDLSVAVNVSTTLLEDRAFIIWLRETLRSSGVAPAKVTVEVTESAAVKDVEQAAAALAQWRSLGVAISIDDYGTGQSSLGYLQRLPASELKIDKSFVQNVVEDSRNAIMVRSTVALAHQLGMKVVAEGIEDEATLAVLRDMECDVAQGYLIGRPMPAADLEKLLGEPAPALAA